MTAARTSLWDTARMIELRQSCSPLVAWVIFRVIISSEESFNVSGNLKWKRKSADCWGFLFLRDYWMKQNKHFVFSDQIGFDPIIFSWFETLGGMCLVLRGCLQNTRPITENTFHLLAIINKIVFHGSIQYLLWEIPGYIINYSTQAPHPLSESQV